MQKITPFLSFDTQAEEAAKFYTSIFPDSKITSISRYGDFDPKRAGQVMTVSFTLRGEEFIALNGTPFTFNEGVSFVVNCETQQEVDDYWNKLTDGGQEIACGWLKDRFGLAWQIVPRFVWEAFQRGDAAKTNRMMSAVLQMKKLDLAELQRAYEGK
jgi:predicted 3-demethylubiquinone-9 3-methyltransferase (glyoxalase superfamily)